MLKMTANVRQKVALIPQIAKQFTFVIPRVMMFFIKKKIQTRGFELLKSMKK